MRSPSDVNSPKHRAPSATTSTASPTLRALHPNHPHKKRTSAGGHKHDTAPPGVGDSVVRYGGYGLVIVAMLLLLPLAGQRWGAEAFSEGHIVEWTQFSLIAFSAALLMVSAWRLSRWRSLLGVLGSIAALASVRELDSLLDNNLPLGWKGPAAVCALAGAAFALCQRAAFARQVESFVQTPGFGILWVGLVVVVAFAQLVGHEPFLATLFAEDYYGRLKRIVEELLELFGYVLILIGSIETISLMRRRLPR